MNECSYGTAARLGCQLRKEWISQIVTPGHPPHADCGAADRNGCFCWARTSHPRQRHTTREVTSGDSNRTGSRTICHKGVNGCPDHDPEHWLESDRSSEPGK